jgi:hypothetical protein
MIRICCAGLLLFLNGCFGCGTGSRREDVDPRLKVYRPAVPPLGERHTSSRLDLVPAGAWVSYRLTKDGNETVMTYGAVKTEESTLWIEVTEEDDPKTVSLRRVTFDGEILSARFQEFPASGPPSEIADQPVSPGLESEPERGRPAQVTESKKKIKVGERTVDATVFKMVFRDESVGREYEEEEAWSADVPPILEHLEVGEKPAGLLYRKSATGSVQIVDWGTGYTAKIR